MVYIYVLELENNKYYVGKTTNPDVRLETHFKVGGSCWTSIHKPKKVLELIENCDDYDEDKYTLKYMKEYGIENVRGGSFCKIKLDFDQCKVLNDMIKSLSNRCYNCNEHGHMAKDCKKIKINNFIRNLSDDLSIAIKYIEEIQNKMLNFLVDIDKLSYIKKLRNQIVEISNINNKIETINDRIKIITKNKSENKSEMNELEIELNRLKKIEIKDKLVTTFISEINKLYKDFYEDDYLYMMKDLEVKCLKMLDLYLMKKSELNKMYELYNGIEFLNDVLKELYNRKILAYDI